VKVVFDTNILVSALVFPGGKGEAALWRIVREQDQLIISRPILDELLGTLGRKFAREAEELAHVAVFLSELGTLVKPRRRLQVVSDDPDNRILECAIAGRADAIVTGDKELLRLRAFRHVRVLSLRRYLDE
jgi:putative PIN family toxin of toxin-antitoxin system